ncbi:hypothetical protein TCA2_4409 [Paenibacillus sp. TCA20]|uniref:DEAD/DEAH box helicase n=1 Tax=Paenibacillus sp. TCA20 TaxID=1499968 RepID=UPI0004DA86DE|nr:DEAD/DEAH box helicase [Paenibacillus sp. TCA20]GAK41917.1 hypothetical protein TCA2_4409 [Paenibacillus sp. TCA20]
MATRVSDKLFELVLHNKGRGPRISTFIDLIVLERIGRSANNMYLVNTMNAGPKQTLLAYEMNEHKSGTISPLGEGVSRDEIMNVFVPEKDFYDSSEQKIDDIVNTLYVAKAAKNDIKKKEMRILENKQRVESGIQPLGPHPELILAWDGDIFSEVYRVLNDRYNTPMLPEWKEEIVQACYDHGLLTNLEVKSYGKDYDLEAALLRITEENLEAIISEGIRSYSMPFAILDDGPTEEESVLKNCTTLDVYLENFAGELGQRIQENSVLRFDPTKEEHHRSLYHANLHANTKGVTGLFPPQADVVMGCANTIKDDEDDYVFVVGEMGSGKSPMGALIPYVTHAIRSGMEKPKPYRALVFVPAIMVEKWKREIEERIPDVKVYQINNWRDVHRLRNMPYRPTEIEYYVMSSDAAKQTYPIEPVMDFRKGYVKNHDYEEVIAQKRAGKKIRIRMTKENSFRNGAAITRTAIGPEAMYCPQCGQPIKKTKEKYSDEHYFQLRRGKDKWAWNQNRENYRCRNKVSKDALPKHQRLKGDSPDQECGFIFWSAKKLPARSLERKVSPAWYLNKHLRRGFFEYLIADEVHEYKSGDSDRANAFGQLINHTNKQILLTGTLLGGMARDIFYLLARLDAKKLKLEGITYDDESRFVENYGVYERSMTEFTDDRKGKKRKKQLPGVSPLVFPRFLMSNCAFIELGDLGYALPPYREIPMFIEMEDEHRRMYDELEENIMDAMGQGGMKHLSSYITKLYQYADMPFKHEPITYLDEHDKVKELCQPYNFPEDYTPSKYYALQSLLEEQIEERGRKVLVYGRFTGGDNGVDTWLYERLKQDGYNVGILRSSGTYDGMKMPKQEDRETWLRKNMERYDWDVLVTNSRLVAVGLDLLMFPHIHFYQMDYSAYNYMQASRRSWRIKQTEEVEVSTSVYRNTIQADVLESIAKKIDAAMALQGKFSEEGLRAMADSGDGINALAKKLMSEGRLDNINSIEDRWKRINASYEQLQNSSYEGYDSYEMNPLGIDKVREIQKGLVNKMRIDVASGKITQNDLNSYMDHIEDIFRVVEDVREYNKGLRKNERIVEGQGAFAFF